MQDHRAGQAFNSAGATWRFYGEDTNMLQEKSEPHQERFYERDREQCKRKSLVMMKPFPVPRICVCELVQGHDGECERQPSRLLAGCQLWDKLPFFETVYVPE